MLSASLSIIPVHLAGEAVRFQIGCRGENRVVFFRAYGHRRAVEFHSERRVCDGKGQTAQVVIDRDDEFLELSTPTQPAYLVELEYGALRPLRERTVGTADLVDYVRQHGTVLTDAASPPGCLLVNAMLAGDAPDARERYIKDLRSAIEQALRRAANLGEISARQIVGAGVHRVRFDSGPRCRGQIWNRGDDLQELVDGE